MLADHLPSGEGAESRGQKSKRSALSFQKAQSPGAGLTCSETAGLAWAGRGGYEQLGEGGRDTAQGTESLAQRGHVDSGT